MPKIAVVQHPPVLLDRDATLQRAVELVAHAAREGARLVVFPEAFVPGYPTWIWRLRPGGDMKLSGTLHEQLLANAVSMDDDLERDDLAPLRRAAREGSVTILCGVNERDTSFSRTTLFNSYVVIGPDGSYLNRHRKLMPTNPERMVWGFGDATGLRVVETDCGRVGTLICWENYMPLARYSLYAQGVELYVAPTWDNGEGWVGTLQHIAREGRCWVVGCCSAIRGADIPADLPGGDELFADRDEWINSGDSCVVAPDGVMTAGPMHRETGLLLAEIEPDRVAAARRSLDVAGHYSRPDIFRLTVRRAPQDPLVFDDVDSH